MTPPNGPPGPSTDPGPCTPENAARQVLPAEAAIPRRWLPSWIRWPIRVLLLPFVILDDAIQRLARRLLLRGNRLEGACTRGGRCCRHVLVPAGDGTGLLSRVLDTWFTQVHGFYRRGFDVELPGGGHAWVMGCRHLRADGSCQHHVMRPLVCRRYPAHAMEDLPTLLPGCGYRVVTPARLRVLP